MIIIMIILIILIIIRSASASLRTNSGLEPLEASLKRIAMMIAMVVVVRC